MPIASRARSQNLRKFACLPGDVRIAEIPFLTQLDLRAEPAGPAAAAVGKSLGGELPAESCTAPRIDDVDVLWLGPDEWLLLARPGPPPALQGLVRPALG